VSADDACLSPPLTREVVTQDLDEQYPRIQRRHHQAEHDAGDQPVEAASGQEQ
jgi:hypothetical protein